MVLNIAGNLRDDLWYFIIGYTMDGLWYLMLVKEPHGQPLIFNKMVCISVNQWKTQKIFSRVANESFN
ncbi:hypothetical protein HanRHA438_Chr00c59g0859741 [Helianthus annuus]|nr:hypothetical protein HanIR_Chr07g0330061 [Helianthus annuus]KAJ0953633.1 hypothetical protein HanRHA438_Chr00c59g0859741 [Helianthus annuus]